MKNYASRENCDSRARWISTLVYIPSVCPMHLASFYFFFHLKTIGISLTSVNISLFDFAVVSKTTIELLDKKDDSSFYVWGESFSFIGFHLFVKNYFSKSWYVLKFLFTWQFIGKFCKQKENFEKIIYL